MLSSASLQLLRCDLLRHCFSLLDSLRMIYKKMIEDLSTCSVSSATSVCQNCSSIEMFPCRSISPSTQDLQDLQPYVCVHGPAYLIAQGCWVQSVSIAPLQIPRKQAGSAVVGRGGALAFSENKQHWWSPVLAPWTKLPLSSAEISPWAQWFGSLWHVIQ